MTLKKNQVQIKDSISSPKSPTSPKQFYTNIKSIDSHAGDQAS